MLPALIAAVSVATTAGAAAPPPSATEAHAFAVELARAGPRPAASAAERRAHERVAARFGQAGLRVGTERFAVPGKGTSRDVIGIRDVPARCLVIVMAHADSVPPAPGADDNASGVGTIVALAPGAGDRARRPSATRGSSPPAPRSAPTPGSPTTSAHPRSSDGSSARGDSETSASRSRCDEVGRGTRFELRSPVAKRATPHVERRDPRSRRKSGGQRHVAQTTSATGNSDHRELALAGAPAAKLGVPDEPCPPHRVPTPPDRLQRGAFARVLRVVWPLLREVS